MPTGRKSLIRIKPYGPIAAMESDENFDLPDYARKVLTSSWRSVWYRALPPLFKQHELGRSAGRALRGPPNEAPSGPFLLLGINFCKNCVRAA